MLGEKRLCEVYQIGNDFVVPIRPEGGELKAVAGLFGFIASLALLFDVAAAGGVGIILRVGAVGDDENLDVFKKTACCPEAVALVALDLVERLADGHAAPLELDMYQRQTVDENGHIVARVVIARGFLVLVEHLQTVVVDVFFVQQVNILGRAAVLSQHLHMIELNPARLFQNAVVRARDAVPKEARPLAVRKGVVVQPFQLAAQVGDERGFVVDLQVFIPLRAEKPQELLLQRRLALIAVRQAGIRRVFRHDRALCRGGDDVELGHDAISPLFYPLCLPTYIQDVCLNGCYWTDWSFLAVQAMLAALAFSIFYRYQYPSAICQFCPW